MANRFSADFGATAEDYSRHRAGFPAALFTRLAGHGIGLPGQRMVDLGTGTGALARGFARRGAIVTGIDIAEPMLDEALAALLAEGFAEEPLFVPHRCWALVCRKPGAAAPGA